MGTSKRLRAVAVVAFAGLLMVVVLRWTRATVPATPAIARLSAAPVTSSALSDMRELISKAIAEAPVRQRAELFAYLDGLEAQARRQGRVTALEVEPGVEMILRHGDLDEANRFSQRMQKVQAELGGVSPTVEPSVAERRLQELLADIERTRGERQQALIREYQEKTRDLPPDAQVGADLALSRAAAPHQGPPEAAALDALWKGIESAPSEDERQLLIREYVGLVQGLPAEEELRRLAELQNRFGARAAVTK
jgi:hypothetical protein